MKSSKILFALLATVALSACDETVKIENGKVPQNLLPYVQKIVGEYNSTSNRITLSIENDALVVKAAKDVGDTLEYAGCNSKIGNLLDISFSGDIAKGDVAVTGANFDFNPNFCTNIQGRRFTIENLKTAGSQTTFDTSLLNYMEAQRDCHIEVITEPNGSTSAREVCTTNWAPVNVRDSFIKILQ